MSSCEWGTVSEMYRAYHDEEWGVPVHDDRRMFEHLMLECMQCGLSWTLMLRKREIFRACFADFDYDRIAEFGDPDVERILNTDGMIRSPRKIRAVIRNARAYLKVREEFGTFCDYLWAYTDGKTVLYEGRGDGRVPVSNGLSAGISKDLKKKGFTYVGPVTVYSHLQACGIVCDHGNECPCYHKIVRENPTAVLPPDEEVF